MGEEVDAVLIKKVKLTQDVLGNFIRRPPLTEKHLVKPPFRFIHDIVMSVIDNTGFLYGLYEGSELDAATITTRETKTAFMQKLVDCLSVATGEDIDVKISKILAGQEPGKTNDLLICLGNALAGNVNSDKAVQQITGKDLKNPNNPPVKAKVSSSDVPKDKKKNPNAAVAKIKEANSPYSTSVQQKKPGKAPVSNARKAPPEKTKPTNVPPSKVQGKQSKAAISSSPPKAPSKALNRQGSSDRLATAPRGKQAPAEKSPSKQPSASNAQAQANKDGRRTSVRGSIDDGPPSLGEGDGNNIHDETRVGGGGGGSRRESLTSITAAALVTAAPQIPREPRSMSKYGRAGPSQRGSLSGPSGGTGDDVVAGPEGAFVSTEAHADDLEQQEFMGELEFLLKKHGYEGDSGRNESDDNENHDNDGEGIDEGAKTETLNNNNIPGFNQKEPLTRKSSVENSNTGQTQAVEGNNEEPVESIDNELNTSNINDNESDDNQNENVLSSPPSLPKSRQSATTAKTRIKTGNIASANRSPRTPSASTSAMSLSNAALGRPLSPTRSLSTKLSPTILLPDINEKPTLRPPSARPHTSQMRPGGPVTAMSIARPPSARPAPPRPKTALFQDKDENTFRPTTAKVANVLLDAEDADDDNNYIVHEVAAPEKASGELQLDESTDLGISGNLMEENIDMILDPEQRGLLVTQMLDAQNKLEDGSRLAPSNLKKTEIEREAMGDKDRMRWREMTVTEVEKLKNLMQLMARNANPLGKLMDFVQEDVDAMQRDLNKWREESRKLDNSLEAAQEETERSLEPLRRKMAELDEAIQDRQDSIAATKMTIYRQEERIRKVLTGLDRVKPRNGTEPIITSADLQNMVDLDDNYDYGDKNKVYFKKPSTHNTMAGINPSSPSPV